MLPQFHLSLGVASLGDSTDFFTRILPGAVTHRDSSGYVNIDLWGTQITLKETDARVASTPEFHFGVNLPMTEFERLAERILASGYAGIVAAPILVDAGTPMERRKMYLQCPTGYLIELKGLP